MRPTVYIRVDGNSEIGLGHIIRCSALACMLRNYFNIIFFIQSAPNEIITKLKDLGFACNFIETEDDFINRVDSDKIIVLDGYGFNTKYMLRIKARNAKLIVIDDLHDKEYYADLIINTVPGVEQKDYLSKPNTKFALGPDFALLRPAFLEKALKERQLLSIDSVLICFGGSDSKNITQRILQIILEFQHFKRIIIVTGHSYTFLHSLKQLTSTDPRIELYYGLAEEQLASLMSESGIAIVPSSGVLYETIACGCIPISGTYVENQKHVYKSMLENGYIIDCGDFSNDKIRLAISLLSSQKVNQQKIIDGKSGRRILIKIFESLTSIRKVQHSDIKKIFDWANDPIVRNNSINKTKIEWEDHVKWFNSKISSDLTRFYILELSGIPLGQIRYDLVNENEWLINYSIDGDMRGLGLGRLSILLSFDFFSDTSFKAYVSAKNIASCKIFEHIGFTMDAQEYINSELFYIYKYRL